jgi:hypothetical protein
VWTSARFDCALTPSMGCLGYVDITALRCFDPSAGERIGCGSPALLISADVRN